MAEEKWEPSMYDGLIRDLEKMKPLLERLLAWAPQTIRTQQERIMTQRREIERLSMRPPALEPTLVERLRGQTTALGHQAADRIEALERALKTLTVYARTSGGTAGRDDMLCVACDAAEKLLTS